MKNKCFLTGCIILIFLIIGGCHYETEIFVYNVEIPGSTYQYEDGFVYFPFSVIEHEDNPSVDLEYWIDDVRNFGFQLWVSNSGDSASGFSLYFSQYKDTMDFSDADMVRRNALEVFRGAVIQPGSSKYFDWQASLPYTLNRDKAYLLLKDVDLMCYYVPDNAEVQLDSITIIVTTYTKHYSQ
ncbi:MAG: hypothetical protein R3F48_03150 [Candidatus Zixiibacteriota bacterium]